MLLRHLEWASPPKQTFQSLLELEQTRRKRQIEEGLERANHADWVFELEPSMRRIKVACQTKEGLEGANHADLAFDLERTIKAAWKPDRGKLGRSQPS